MRGCQRKLWENIMEAIVKIDKTNTRGKTRTKIKTKIDKDKNVGK